MEQYMNTDDFLSGIDTTFTEDVAELLHTAGLAPTVELLPAVQPQNVNPWPARLPFDIALKEDEETLSLRYGLDSKDFERLYLIPSFRREVADHTRTIREDGVTFRHKARVQAEMYLEVLDDIVNDTDVSAATRLDAIKSTVKWADLEPKVDKAAKDNQPQFNIQINL